MKILINVFMNILSLCMPSRNTITTNLELSVFIFDGTNNADWITTKKLKHYTGFGFLKTQVQLFRRIATHKLYMVQV